MMKKTSMTLTELTIRELEHLSASGHGTHSAIMRTAVHEYWQRATDDEGYWQRKKEKMHEETENAAIPAVS
jgi:predicted transcriptional regulator